MGGSLVVTQASLSGNHLPGWGLQLDSALDISLAQVPHAVIIPATVASYLMGQQLSVWHRQLSIGGRFLSVAMMLQNGKGDPGQQSMKLWQEDYGLWPCIPGKSPTPAHSHLCYTLAPCSPLLVHQLPSAQFSRAVQRPSEPQVLLRSVWNGFQRILRRPLEKSLKGK